MNIDKSFKNFAFFKIKNIFFEIYPHKGPQQSVKLVSKEEDSEISDESAAIIGISRLDVLKDDNEEVVLCNANGLTHIISAKWDQENSLKFIQEIFTVHETDC